MLPVGNSPGIMLITLLVRSTVSVSANRHDKQTNKQTHYTIRALTELVSQ